MPDTLTKSPGNTDTLLGRLAAQMDFIVKQIEHLDGKVDEVNTRLIQIEAKNLAEEVNELKKRLIVLEIERTQRRAVIGIADWLPKWLGWAVAGFGILINWFLMVDAAKK